MNQIGLEPRPMGTLTERLAAFLEESTGEVAELERRREELESERADRIVAIREEYAEKIKAVDAELDMVRRLHKALEGPRPREPKPAKSAAPTQPGAHRFRPTPEKLNAVLRAIADGADIQPLMMEHDAVDFSKGTVDNALIHLREDGLVRLTGERRAYPDREDVHTKARTFALTPEGEAFVSANLSTNGTPA